MGVVIDNRYVYYDKGNRLGRMIKQENRKATWEMSIYAREFAFFFDFFLKKKKKKR